MREYSCNYKSQTFVGSRFLNVKIFCFSLTFLTVNKESLGFGRLVATVPLFLSLFFTSVALISLSFLPSFSYFPFLSFSFLPSLSQGKVDIKVQGQIVVLVS